MIDWLASLLVPDDGRLALIGDSDSEDIFRIDIPFFQRAVDHFLSPLPDFHGIMFHPTGLRINLPMLLLVHGDDVSPVIENHKTSAGCTLIDCRNVLGHHSPLS